jgi:hypothetical protein
VKIKDELRGIIAFKRLNLLEPLPPGHVRRDFLSQRRDLFSRQRARICSCVWPRN